MTRLESKIKPAPVVRQFKKEYDSINVTIDTVELTDNDITKLSNCRIANNANDSWTGDFYMSGDTGISGDNRVLHINIPFAGYAELLPTIIEILTELETNDFDEVEEFESEKRFRLAQEAFKARLEQQQREAEVNDEVGEAPDNVTPLGEPASGIKPNNTVEENTPVEEATPVEDVTEAI